MTHELVVWLNAQRVGRLFLQHGRIAFQYDLQWLDSNTAFPISHSLPLQEAVFDDRVSRPFFRVCCLKVKSDVWLHKRFKCRVKMILRC